MSITYPLSLPTTKTPARITISASTAVAISRSNFSYATQVQAFTGQLWLAEITLPPMERADAAPWMAWLLKLNGQEGTFLLGDDSARTPRGAATGTPLVKGAGQTGQSLITDGWTSGVTNILRAGDWFAIDQRLYMNLNDVNSNGSGEATLDIWPRLRESPADNAPLTTSQPQGLFRLQSNSYGIFDVNAAKNYATSFAAVEAL